MSYATPEQFERAGRIVRHLMYQNTLPGEKKHSDVPYFNYGSPGSEPVIGIEGHSRVYIEIPNFHVRPKNIEAIRELPPIRDRDSISFSEDGFKIYVNQEEGEE